MTAFSLVRRRKLIHLKLLDPASYKAANVALRSGFVQLAAKLIVEAMLAAFDRLTQPQPTPPAKAKPSKVRCDAYLRHKTDGAITLNRCRRLARCSLTIQNSTGADPYTLRRCPDCANELRAKVAGGAAFEILAEEAL
jgi:hypothetical protein